MHYPIQLPLTPPASPPTTKLAPLSPPTRVHVVQLPKGLRKKKAKKRRSLTEDKQDTDASNEHAQHTAKPLTPCCPTPLNDDISDLYLDPPCPNVWKLIRSMMVQDLLSASRAVCPCREITIHVPLLPDTDPATSCESATTRRHVYRAQQEKRKLLGMQGDHLPRLGEEHGTCPIGKCGIKRCLLWDSLLDGEIRDVTVKMHIQPSLVSDLALPAFTMSFKLHVHEDDITGSAFVCAPELVRAILPRFFACFEKRMHSLYTLNHPFGRGMPLDPSDDSEDALDPHVWKKWAGCPQALQGRKCNPDESKTRIWLLDDGTAEVSLGAECEPDECTIAPPINSSKGKSRAC
ncbi:hypothetical protein QFC20_001390 [Naganishia adeliensis]|uniref:Uncharacterized protein n=1 Tax=Naganishia adeliensis TaxID=92952 RepID=A0ACC2WSB1_9TREE|nr:hypothetical protein QFC20_001390 [Naganishia adeliensis]